MPDFIKKVASGLDRDPGFRSTGSLFPIGEVKLLGLFSDYAEIASIR